MNTLTTSLPWQRLKILFVEVIVLGSGGPENSEITEGGLRFRAPPAGQLQVNTLWLHPQYERS